jgi:hypothetical protein
MANAWGQSPGNFRTRYIPFSQSSVKIDTLSIIPGSIIVEYQNMVRDTNFYSLDAATGIITWKDSSVNKIDSARISYRVFPIDFTRKVQIRDRQLLGGRDVAGEKFKYTESSNAREEPLFALEGLNRSGSISRGITVGTNQDAVVSSSLNLQLEGKLGNDISILAAITDDNIPIQAAGNTQQLQEFDRVFIQLSNNTHTLIAGDFVTQNSDWYFLRYLKKSQGGLYNLKTQVIDQGKRIGTLTASAGAAVSKGKFARQLFNGIEGNQGPYRLTGAENENFIVVLSGSERIFIDGQLLQRGQDRDYIIDYNTAELTFTTRRLITKDLRIVAEYQYSDRNYARTMLTANVEFQQEKLRTYVAYYSEQDSKNQPLQQTLSTEDKKILAEAGDDFSEAVVPRADSVGYNVNEILYAKKDTLVNSITYSIYQYSTNSDSAYYRLSFSNVGNNKGDYVQLNGVTNGRAYQWVAPVNGVSQGSYEPVIQLVTPKLRRLAIAGADYKFNKNFIGGVEVAASKNDLNLFSTIDNADDNGTAVRLKASWKTDSIPGGWRAITEFQSEIAGKDFNPIENYRAVEFVRDWNLTGLVAKEDEILNFFNAAFRKSKKGEFRLGFRNYVRGNSYRGWMQIAGADWNLQPITIKADGSYLLTDGLTNSKFLRHKEEVKYAKGTWNPGLRFEQERNELLDTNKTNLSINAFSFRIAEAFIQRPDTVRLPVTISVIRRYDDGISGSEFKQAMQADMINASTGYRTSKSRINLLMNYRNLQITDSTITFIRPEETMTARIEGNTTKAKGGVILSGYYEAGTGREARRQYSYIEVAQGTGVYAWVDYNDDGIPQLNEFEIAVYKDQANYIRIFTPTDQYIKVYFNQFNAVINLTPAAWMKNNKSIPAKFALQSSVRFDNRLTGTSLQEGWNPFPTTVPDTQLISTQAGTRHTLFFNRSSTAFSSDLTWQQQQARQLLSNGIEDRLIQIITWNGRSNLNKWLNIQLQLEGGTKRNSALAFTGRNFNIKRYKAEPRFNIQPGATYRLSFSYRHEQKENIAGEGENEKALIRDAGMEWRYSSVKQGLITAKFNYLLIGYNADANTALGYEMLEALKEGANITWGFSLQRNLGNSLQLGVTYDGRKPSGINTIHTGSAQVRAYF